MVKVIFILYACGIFVSCNKKIEWVTTTPENDFSRDWYSYNETDGDFEMRNFSIDNDKETETDRVIKISGQIIRISLKPNSFNTIIL
ncbi:hypothetical protein FACS1894174_07250 [Bacteroidia bacterium]|nr:hypothetical protein FACS1894155_05600 [Bacteroidia bacterium]GHV22514.1 hypothetical protein FACS1894174_07250 [Bacteroidia bacterium]